MIGKLKERISDFRLKTKFLVILFSLLLLACTVILLSVFFVFHQYDQELYLNTSQILNMAIDDIENDLYAIEQAGAWTVCNSRVQTALNDPEIDFAAREPVLSFGQASQKIYEALDSYYSKNENVIFASIYVDGQRFNLGGEYSNWPETDFFSIQEAAKNGEGKAVWLPAGGNDFQLFYTREIRELQNMTLKPLGLLLLRVNMEKIVDDRLKKGLVLEYKPYTVISNEQGQILFSDMPEELQKEDSPPSESSYRHVALGGKSYFATYSVRSQFGLRYATYLPIDSIASSLRLLTLAVLIISVVAILGSLYSCSKLVSLIIQHFDVLVKKMRLFREGNFQEIWKYPYSNRQDELGYLHRSFDDMTRDFDQLVKDNYIKQLALKDAHIKSLQEQINPHFLFNILQTITWKAKLGKSEDISQMTEALGKLLRYSLREQQELVPLKKEIEMTACYISIQRYRYGERLSVSFQIPAKYHEVLIPPMALQNLVENAIKHGLESMLEPCHISITAQDAGDVVSLTVEDNGPGVDELRLREQGKETTSGMGIGLSNVRQRLYLLLGEKCDVRLYNTGNGTRAELILLPSRAGPNSSPEGADRKGESHG